MPMSSFSIFVGLEAIILSLNDFLVGCDSHTEKENMRPKNMCVCVCLCVCVIFLLRFNSVRELI